MAEFVQQRAEAFVPILEHIVELKLLDKNEVKFFSDRFYSFEYKIQSQKRTLEDVLTYANYLADMVLVLEKQRKVVQNFTSKKEVEDELKRKICSILGSYTRDFRARTKYWQGAIQVAFKLKSKAMLNKTMEAYVQELGQINKTAWCQAIQYYYDSNDGGPLEGIKVARVYVQRSIRAFPRDLQVYLWGMELELKHESFITTLEQSQSKVSQDLDFRREKENCMNFARLFYNNAKESCWAKGCTVDLYKRFFALTEKYPNFNDLTNFLIKELEANCSSEEETYELLAMMEIEKKSNISEGISYLEKGLKVTPTMKMYDIAVRILVTLLKMDSPKKKRISTTLYVYEKVLEILRQGHNNDMLSAENYSQWIEVQMIWRPSQLQALGATSEIDSSCPNKQTSAENQDKFYKDLESLTHSGLKKYPDNSKLLALRIKLSALMSPNTETLAILHAAVDKTGAISSNTIYYDFLLVSDALTEKTETQPNRGSVKSLLKMKDDPYRETLILLHLKSCYLKGFGEFMKKTGNPLLGLECARQFFEEIKGFANYYSLYKAMAKIELMNVDLSEEKPLKRVRTIMETAILHFGANEIEVWQDYIDIERKLYNIKEVTELQARARKTLTNSDLVQQFVLLQ